MELTDFKECNLGQDAPQVQHRRIGDDADGMRLDNYLVRVLKGVPRSHVYRLIRSGQVRVNGGRVRPRQKLVSGDQVRVPPVRTSAGNGPGRPPDGLIERVRHAVIEESEDWLLLNKPAGLAVHAGSGIRFGIIEVLRADRPEEHLELVHRLDRDTSGCLLVARHRAALTRLRRSLRDAATEKIYHALVVGRWRGGSREIDAALARDREIGGERLSVVDAAGKSALSRFTPLEVFASASLVEVAIATGRTHQIRVHAAYAGHPIVGDPKYGDREADRRLPGRRPQRLCLHAARLNLPGMAQPLRAPLPEDITDLLQRLRDEDAV